MDQNKLNNREVYLVLIYFVFIPTQDKHWLPRQAAEEGRGGIGGVQGAGGRQRVRDEEVRPGTGRHRHGRDRPRRRRFVRLQRGRGHPRGIRRPTERHRERVPAGEEGTVHKSRPHILGFLTPSPSPV